ncbi:MAG: GtrA family protein [Nitrosomonas sp.]
MIKREFGIFLIVGSLTVLVDFAVYRGLLWLDITSIDLAKGVSFLAGTIFAYFANRFWTFGHQSIAAGSVGRFAVLYLSTLIANIAVNALALKALIDVPSSLQWAFLLATGVSATLNFLGMKFFVFHSQAKPANPVNPDDSAKSSELP